MSEFWQRANKDTSRGEIKDGDTRYVMFRTDVVAAMVNQLPENTRAEVLKSFAAAVETHGGKSLARYFDMVDNDVDALLNTVANTAPDLGWGVWQFTRDAKSLRLVVTNSPYVAFNSPKDSPSCAPILGMFTALANMVFNAANVKESACAKNAAEHCVFLAENLTQ